MNTTNTRSSSPAGAPPPQPPPLPIREQDRPPKEHLWRAILDLVFACGRVRRDHGEDCNCNTCMHAEHVPYALMSAHRLFLNEPQKKSGDWPDLWSKWQRERGATLELSDAEVFVQDGPWVEPWPPDELARPEEEAAIIRAVVLTVGRPAQDFAPEEHLYRATLDVVLACRRLRRAHGEACNCRICPHANHLPYFVIGAQRDLDDDHRRIREEWLRDRGAEWSEAAGDAFCWDGPFRDYPAPEWLVRPSATEPT